MTATTLCLLINDNKILLAMKKRGFGAGKWNGLGGKVHANESISQAAARELEEEAGVKTEPANLKSVGNIKFYFNEKPDWDIHMHIFTAGSWTGEPIETEEMRPQWFDFRKIPYSEMWVDDQYWLPLVLAGKGVEATFYFDGDGKSFSKHELKEIKLA